ncbi:MAG: sugar ABC transporter ATP-binding protein [Lachnospiraceae bacterium]|nr:sugar ABC transporter ATP-binding protein [Lachnospiraceae bacterium]
MADIELRHITKTFNGVYALNDVSLSFNKGEVHAVVGENGAGKSTIMKVLSGLYFADSGEIWIDGEKKNIANVADAQKAGVSVVYQELNLMPSLTVAENIYLHNLPTKGVMVDQKEMNRKAQELLDRMHVSISASQKTEMLSVSEQQMVEIAKALSFDSDIIIMDEPTASLNVQEVDALYGIVRDLKKAGKAVIYISHRLKEIFDITDRVSILRDGHFIASYETKDLTEDILISNMVGRQISGHYTTADHPYGETVLEVKGLSKAGVYEDISFELHKGEILGIAGLMGCFREEIVQSLYGLVHPDAGKVVLNGTTVVDMEKGLNKLSTPLKANRQGIGYVTEDRKGSGIFALMNVRENLTISILDKLAKMGLVHGKDEQELLNRYTEQMHMKYSGFKQRIGSLSGGNQQKFLLARALATGCRLLIMLEPTRGIDVGAKAEIYSLLEDLAKSGMSILMISSELPEIIGNCHRSLVIFQGKLTGVLDQSEFDETLIMQCATGNQTYFTEVKR